jgi:elongation factor P--(R)-beta-lysine ligase
MTGLWSTQVSLQRLQQRALMLSAIRAFFDDRNVLEVETPLLSRFCVTDPHLDSFSTTFRGRDYYLNTSPEYAMKRLLASYPVPVYQVCKSFRNDELGRFHNPEFSMLEWYRPGYHMTDLINEIGALVAHLARCMDIDLDCDYRVISYQQAFETATGLNPHTLLPEQCYQYALDHDIDIPQGMSVDRRDKNDWLDWLLTQCVLPALPQGRFTFIYDYPESQSALAQLEQDSRGQMVAKRFELLYGELELANGFVELTEPQQQYARFEKDNRQRLAMGKPQVRIDEYFMAALKSGIPYCSGVAMGLDRLLMILTGAQSINEVIAFNCENA